MKKLSLITLSDEKEDTLKKLQKLGTVHIEISEGFSEKLEQFKEQIALLEQALFAIGRPDGAEQKDIDTGKAMKIADEISVL